LPGATLEAEQITAGAPPVASGSFLKRGGFSRRALLKDRQARSSNPSGPLLKAASSHDSAVAARAALAKSAHRGWKPLPQNKKTWTAAQDNTARHNPLFGHCDCN